MSRRAEPSGRGRAGGANVWLVTPYFWPEIAASVPLVRALAEDLAAAGHRVTVLTSRPSRGALRLNRVRSLADADLSRQRLRIVRLRNPFSRHPALFAKLLEYAWFSLWVLWRVLLSRGIHVCIVGSNPPLLALPVALIGRFKRYATVYDLQDLFPDSAAAAKIAADRGLLFRMLRRLERWTYAAVHEVVTICESYRQHVLNVTATARVRVIPNWVDTAVMRPIPKEQSRFAKDIGLDGQFTVVYAGTIGFLQDMDVLLEAAYLLQNSAPEVNFVVVGSGPQKQRTVTRAHELSLNNCHFYDYQPEELVAHVYSAGDVGVIPMRPRSDPMPSKTWNIMACGRPVVAAADLDSELAMVLQETGAGMVVGPGDPHALARAILALYRDPVKRQAMGAIGKAYVERTRSRPVVTAMYERAVRELLQQQLGPGLEQSAR